MHSKRRIPSPSTRSPKGLHLWKGGPIDKQAVQFIIHLKEVVIYLVYSIFFVDWVAWGESKLLLLLLLVWMGNKIESTEYFERWTSLWDFSRQQSDEDRTMWSSSGVQSGWWTLFRKLNSTACELDVLQMDPICKECKYEPKLFRTWPGHMGKCRSLWCFLNFA